MIKKLKRLKELLFAINADRIVTSLGGEIDADNKNPSPLKSLSRILVTRGLLVDLLSSLIFMMTSVSLSVLVELYTPQKDILYNLRYSVVILVVLFLIARRLRVYTLAVFPLHILSFAGYLIFLSTATPVFSSASSIVVFVTVAVLNFAYSIICIARPRTGKLKTDGALLSLVTNILLFIPVYYLDEGIRVLYYDRLFFNIYGIFILFFIARQISEFEDGYYHSMRSSIMPISRIRNQNYKTIIFVVGGSLLAMVMLVLVPINFLKKYLLYYFQRFMEWLFSHFSSTNNKQVLGLMHDLPPELEEAEEGEVPAYLNSLFYVVIAVVVVAFVIMIIRFIIDATKNLNSGNESNTQLSEFVTDTIEKVNAESGSNGRRNNFGKGHERAMRKKFYAAVKRGIHKGANINRSDSPWEMASAVKSATGKSIDELTQEYEEVRYR